MKTIYFYKYHGAGNDFIIIDNRDFNLKLNKSDIAALCDRHFGIGADGLMLLKHSEETDFEMDYYNSDGSGSTMCGNGGRCIVAFAHEIGVISKKTRFIASDGLHNAIILENGNIKLKMIDTSIPQKTENAYFINTGSPHHVEFVHDVRNLDVYAAGKNIRYGRRYAKEGTNVNFVTEIEPGKLNLRTYERGVEDETLACGTGAVATAISYALKTEKELNSVAIKARGGDLNISFEKTNSGFENIWLEGPAKLVFKGEIQL